MHKLYKCVCGKIFDNPQKFNGHKSNCKILLQQKGTLDIYYEKQKYSSSFASRSKSDQATLKRNQELQQWLSEKHTCEKCGKVMTMKFGSGRFCSRACSNSRERSQELKDRVSNSLKGRSAYTKPDGNIVFIKADTTPTDGYQKGNFKLSNCESLNNFSEYLTKKKAKTIKKPKFKLDNRAIDYLNDYNQNVLNSYLSYLHIKSQGKNFDKYLHPCKIISKYYVIRDSEDDRSFNGYLFVHVALAQDLLGRKLNASETVHHINHNKLDNRINNILIFDSLASHAKFHYSKYYLLERLDDTLRCSTLSDKQVQQFFEGKENSLKPPFNLLPNQ